MSKKLEEEILEALKENNNDKMKKVLLKLVSDLEGKTFQDKIKFLEGLDLQLSDRLDLYLTASSIDINSLGFTNEILPFCIEKSMENKQEESLQLISKNDKLQSYYVDFLKTHNFQMKFALNNLSTLLQLPKFKEKVLIDENSISDIMTRNIDFFKNLPEEFGYLISLYNPNVAGKKHQDRTGLKQLYEKYFGSYLNEEELSELCEFQLESNAKKNALKISQQDRMASLKHVLKQVLINKDYYKKLSIIKEKTGLDIKSMLLFAQKYDNSNLYQMLTSGNMIFDDILIEKIKYLASDSKIKDVQRLDKLNEISLEELKNMEKERNVSVQSNLRGGPQSTTHEKIFTDGSSREIRRINQDGSHEDIFLGFNTNHEDGVLDIYKDSMDFPNECTMAFQRAIEAAKQLKSITLVIENELCNFYIPNDITIEQIKVCKDWLELASDVGEYTVAVYDSKIDNCYFLQDGETVNKDEALKFILELNKKIKQEQINAIKMEDLAKKAILEGARSSTMEEAQAQLLAMEKGDDEWGIDEDWSFEDDEKE